MMSLSSVDTSQTRPTLWNRVYHAADAAKHVIHHVARISHTPPHHHNTKHAHAGIMLPVRHARPRRRRLSCAVCRRAHAVSAQHAFYHVPCPTPDVTRIRARQWVCSVWECVTRRKSDSGQRCVPRCGGGSIASAQARPAARVQQGRVSVPEREEATR